MAIGCCRISEENEELKDKNKNLELEVVRMKAVDDERVKDIKTLQKKNAKYIARITTMEASKRRDEKKTKNLRIKRLRDIRRIGMLLGFPTLCEDDQINQL